MLKKLIVKYLKRHPLSEHELELLAIETLDPKLEAISKEEQDEVIKNLAGIEGVIEYLSALMVADVKRYWKASTPIEQFNIRGMYSRTLYLKSRITKAKKPSEEEIIPITKRYSTGV